LWPRRVFSFLAWERQRIDRPLAMTMSVPTLALRESASGGARALLNAFPLPNGPERGAGLADFSVEVPATSAPSTLTSGTKTCQTTQSSASTSWLTRRQTGMTLVDSVNDGLRTVEDRPAARRPSLRRSRPLAITDRADPPLQCEIPFDQPVLAATGTSGYLVVLAWCVHG